MVGKETECRICASGCSGAGAGANPGADVGLLAERVLGSCRDGDLGCLVL